MSTTDINKKSPISWWPNRESYNRNSHKPFLYIGLAALLTLLTPKACTNNSSTSLNGPVPVSQADSILKQYFENKCDSTKQNIIIQINEYNINAPIHGDVTFDNDQIIGIDNSVNKNANIDKSVNKTVNYKPTVIQAEQLNIEYIPIINSKIIYKLPQENALPNISTHKSSNTLEGVVGDSIDTTKTDKSLEIEQNFSHWGDQKLIKGYICNEKIEQAYDTISKK